MTTTKIDTRSTDESEAMGLRLYRNGLIRRGVSPDTAAKATAKGTVVQVKIRAFAELLTSVFYNERAVEDAQMPDSAVGDDLVRLAAAYGITPSTGSGAAGDVVVTCSGSVTYAEGQELVADKTGKRYRVVVTQTVTSGGSVGVIGVDVGRATNLAAGAPLTWVSPPGGSSVSCVVGVAGLTDGQDADDDARLRERLLKRLQNPPGSANWPQLRQWAEEASASVEGAFVYPAVHGPSTAHVAFVVAGTQENAYRRAAPSALVAAVQNHVLSLSAEPFDLFISTVVEQAASVSLKVGIPYTVGTGDLGGGWIDDTPWPSPLATAGVAVTAVATASTITVNATSAPAVGSHIAIWNAADAAFIHAIVAASSGSSGAYVLTLDQSYIGITVGSYVSPDAERIDDYGATLCAQFARLGPGPRVLLDARTSRHPAISPLDPAAITGAMAAAVQSQFGEMTSCVFAAVNGSATTAPYSLPSAATGLNQAPNIWIPTQIGFYAP